MKARKLFLKQEAFIPRESECWVCGRWMEPSERHRAADIKYDLGTIEVSVCNSCAEKINED